MLGNNLKLFSVICRISGSFSSVPLIWDDNFRALALKQAKNTTINTKNISSKKKSYFSPKLHYFHFISVFLIFLQCLFGNNDTATDKSQELIALGILQCFICHLYTCQTKASDIVLYINGHLQFQDMYYGFQPLKPIQKLKLIERLNKLFAQTFVLTGLTFPIAVSVLHWLDPLRATLPGYFLLKSSNKNQSESDLLLNALLKPAIFIFNHWIWQFGVNASVFVNSGLTSLATMAIQKHTEIYWQVYKSQQLSLSQKMLAYRKIQVLVGLANVISQEVALTSLIVAGVGTMSAGVAMLIKISWLENPVLVFIFASCMANGTLIISVCLSGMVSVYTESENLLCSKIKRKIIEDMGKCKRDEFWEKRFWKSVPVTKIKFGAANFIEQLTPLNTLNFSINLIVQILLLGGQK